MINQTKGNVGEKVPCREESMSNVRLGYLEVQTSREELGLDNDIGEVGRDRSHRSW